MFVFVTDCNVKSIFYYENGENYSFVMGNYVVLQAFLEQYFISSFAAGGVQLVYDFGAILEKVVKPYVSDGAITLSDAVLVFEHYYKTNEQLDLYTHSIGAGVIGILLHAFMEFMGPLINQKLNHSIAGPSTEMPLCVYVSKLRDIVSTVVTDKVEDFGRLKKVKESEVDPVSNQGKKKNVKTTERKQAAEQAVEASDDNNDDTISINSCDSDENQFTTLTGVDGLEYHPPDQKKVPSQYSKKCQGGNSGDDNMRKLASFKNYMEKQNLEIKRLQEENEDAKRKLRAIKKKGSSATTTRKDIPAKKKKSPSVSAFVGGSLQKVLDSEDEDSNIHEVD